LWLADLSAFYELGAPITSSRYIKHKFGPVPARILPALKALQEEGVLTIREADHFGKRKKQYLVNVRSEGEFLSAGEKAIVDRAIDHVCDEHTAASVSEATHNHIWKAAEDGEEIPLYTVFAKPGTITDVERSWAQIALDSEAA
jgi:hypothetical protein